LSHDVIVSGFVELSRIWAHLKQQLTKTAITDSNTKCRQREYANQVREVGWSHWDHPDTSKLAMNHLVYGAQFPACHLLTTHHHL